MSKPLDYSKWDHIGDSSDDDSPPPRPRAPAKGSVAASAAAQPGGSAASAASDVPETCEFSEAELLSMQEYEVERPERLNQLLARGLDALERDIDAPSLDALVNSEAVPLFTTIVKESEEALQFFDAGGSVSPLSDRDAVVGRYCMCLAIAGRNLYMARKGAGDQAALRWLASAAAAVQRPGFLEYERDCRQRVSFRTLCLYGDQLREAGRLQDAEGVLRAALGIAQRDQAEARGAALQEATACVAEAERALAFVAHLLEHPAPAT